jgi:hypothetical protein
MSEHDLSRLIQQATEALAERQIERAIDLLTQARAIAPTSPNVEKGLREARRLQTIAERVRALRAEGEDQLALGTFDAAVGVFTQALNLIVENGFFGQYEDLRHAGEIARDLSERARTAAEIEQTLTRSGSADGHPALIRRISELLDLPGPGAHPARVAADDRLRELRLRLEQRIDLHDLLRQAEEAYTAQDYERARRLAGAIPADADPTIRRRAERCQSDAAFNLDEYIRPGLDEAEQLRTDGQWRQALDRLDQLREEFHSNPDIWHRQRDIFVAWAEQFIREGRQALLSLPPAFAPAINALDQAAAILDEGLRAAATRQIPRTSNQAMHRNRDEVADLQQITTMLGTSAAAQSQGERAEALKQIDATLTLIDDARRRGHDYTAVKGAIEVMRQQIQAEVARLADEERSLDEVRTLRAERRLDQALAGATPLARNALLPAVQREATDIRELVLADQDRVKRLLATAATESDPERAVPLLEEAFAIWPAASSNGSPLRTTLINQLMAAANAAPARGASDRAAAYFERVMVLEPENREARQERSRLDQRSQLVGILADAEGQLARLVAQTDATSESAQPLIERLGTLNDQAVELGLAERLHRVREQVEQWFERRSSAERAQRDAKTAATQGDLDSALKHLTAARDLLATQAPATLANQLEATRLATEQLTNLRQAIGMLDEARQAYESLRDDPNDVALQRATSLLNRLTDMLDRAQTAVQRAEAMLPAWVQTLVDDLADLKRRVERAYEAIRANDRMGLDTLRARGGASDAVLASLMQGAEERLRSRIPDLLKQAEAAGERGDTEDQIDLLREVAALDPRNSETKRNLQRLERRLDYQRRSKETRDAVAQAIASNRRVDADREVRKGIDLLLEPAVGLPPRATQIVSQLFALADSQDRMGMGFDVPWQESSGLEVQLGQMVEEHWACRELYDFVRQWREIVRFLSLNRVATSQAAYEDLTVRFRARTLLLNETPEVPNVLEEYQEARSLLINQVKDSVDKRLQTAAEAIRNGKFETARTPLRTLEEDFLKPTFAKFPDLARVEVLADLPTRRDRLLEQADELEVRHNAVTQLVNQARGDFVERKHDAALLVLGQIADETLADLPTLRQEVRTLRDQVDAAQRKDAHDNLRALIVRGTDALEWGDRAKVEEALRALEPIPGTMLVLLTNEDIHERSRVMRLLDERRQAIEASVGELERVTALVATGAYEEALQQIEKLEALRGDRTLREALRAERLKVEPLATQARTASRQIEQGRELIGRALVSRDPQEARGLFHEARQRLIQAQASQGELTSAGQKQLCKELRRTASAGVSLQLARIAWKEERDIEKVRGLIGAAEPEVAESELPEATDIQLELKHFKQQIEREAQAKQAQEAQERREHEIRRRVETALIEGKLPEADAAVQELINVNPASLAITELKQRIERRRNVSQMLVMARELVDQQQFDPARQIVEQLLQDQPQLIEAERLKVQIESELLRREEAKKRQLFLSQARQKLEQQQFVEARAQLRLATEYGVAAAEIAAVDEAIRDEERRWKAAQLDGLHRLFAAQRWGEFFATATKLRSAPQAELMRSDIDDLSQQATVALRDRIAAGTDADELQALYEELSGITPGTENGSPEELLGTIQTRRLRLLLEEADAALKAERYDAALEGAEAVNAEVRSIPTMRRQNSVELRNLDRSSSELRTKAHQAIDAARRRAEEAEDTNARAKQQKLRDATITHVRALLQSSTSLEALNGARNDLDALRATNDADVTELRRTVAAEIDRYERTSRAITISRKNTELRLFDDAVRTLTQMADSFSPLLATEFEREQIIAESLATARRNLNRQLWADALGLFRQATKQDLEIHTTIASDIERCRRELTAHARTEAEQLIREIPPRAEEAAAKLNQIYAEQWSDGDADLTALEQRIKGLVAVQRAAMVIGGLEGDVGAALITLHSVEPLDQNRRVHAGWEQLGQVALAWERGDVDAARKGLQALEPSLCTTDRATTIAARIARIDAASSQLSALEKQVAECLTANPPRFDAAVGLIESASITLADAPHLQSLREQVARAGDAQLATLREQGLLTSALGIARLLARLDGLAAEESSQVAELERERDNRVASALRDASEALHDERIAEARHACDTARRALNLDDPRTDPRLADLVARIETRERDLKTVDARLDQARTQMTAQQWKEAATLLTRSQQEAPRYRSVQNTVEQFFTRLRGQVEALRDAHDYQAALALAGIGVPTSLNDQASLRTLRSEIQKARDAEVATLRAALGQHLNFWELDSVARVLVRARDLAADDQEFAQARQRVEELRDQAPHVRTAMRAGWEAIDGALYDEADLHFARATTSGLPEALRWRSFTQKMHQANADLTARITQLRAGNNAPSLAPVAALFEDGARELEGDDNTLPSILGDRAALTEWRQRALSHALRLAAITRQLDTLGTSIKQQRMQRNYAEMENLYRQHASLYETYQQIWSTAPAPPQLPETPPDAVAPQQPAPEPPRTTAINDRVALNSPMQQHSPITTPLALPGVAVDAPAVLPVLTPPDSPLAFDQPALTDTYPVDVEQEDRAEPTLDEQLAPETVFEPLREVEPTPEPAIPHLEPRPEPSMPQSVAFQQPEPSPAIKQPATPEDGTTPAIKQPTPEDGTTPVIEQPTTLEDDTPTAPAKQPAQPATPALPAQQESHASTDGAEEPAPIDWFESLRKFESED